MEESQTVVAEPASAAAPEYPSSYVEYAAAAAIPDPNSYATQGATDPAASGDQAAPAYAMGASSYGDPSLYHNVDSAYSTVSSAAVGMEHTASAVGHEATNGAVAATTNSAVTGNGENGTLSNETGAAAVDMQYADATDMSSEEDRLWALVRANCLDFNSWTALIQETEKDNNIVKLRKVYDAFLAEFPLCYGYWKKYADHEARLDSLDKVVEVYERAVLAVTYSVDIWVHYCQFAISTNGDPENVRRLFERGLAYVGTDYLSYPLWDEYIHYEYSLQEWSHVAIIYTRILESPIQQLDRYFNSFKEFAGSRPLSEIMTPEEAEMFVEHSKTTDRQHDGLEGETRPDGDQSHESVSASLTGAEELEKYITSREEMYKKAKELDAKIINFETAIRRPYFHVKALDDPELENWHNYLDFMERGDDFNKLSLSGLHLCFLAKLVKLYERCLIACANYPEYWIRYALCMESSGSMELANNALARATQVFVKKQPEIHLFAARFKEFSGDILGARAEYQLLYADFSSALLEAVVRHANMEYRLGNKEAAFAVFEEAIVVEQAKDVSQILPLLYIQQSRFAFLVDGNAEKAREIIGVAVDRVQLSRPLLEAALHLESVLPLPKRIDYMDSLVEKFITPSSDDSNDASTTDREDISSIFLEFLDIFGDSQSIKKAENRHAAIFIRQRSSLPSRKRRAEDYLGSEKAKMPKSYTADPSGQSVMGAYPSSQNQWPAGYGQNPAWPQAAQAQGQQWNPAYASQAGYGGYGSYPYAQAQPQAAVSAPQTAAYGAYPANPAQAYPQQAYAQPAATAYAQPQVPVSQGYYSGYY